MDLNAACDVLTGTGWLAGVPQDIRTALLEGAELRAVPAGATIYGLEDPPDGIYGLADGFLDVLISRADDMTMLVHIARPGWWVGEAALVTNTTRRADLSARTDCVVVYLDPKRVKKVASRNPLLWRYLASLTVLHLDTALGLSAALGTTDVEMKVRATLSRIADPEDPTLRIPIGRADIAEMCGLSRNSVGPVLKKLAGLGLIDVGYGWIKIARI